MPPALISNTGAGSSNAGVSVTTPAIDTTGANFIVIGLHRWTGGTATIADSKGNSWTPIAQVTFSTLACQLFYCQSPIIGAGHTFSQTGTTTYATLTVGAFSGVKVSGSPVDQLGNNGDNFTQVDAPSVTTTEANELLICALSWDNTATVSVTNGFTILNQIPRVTGQCEGGALAYKIKTTAGATGTTRWSWTGTTDAVTRIASFKEFVPGGGSVYGSGAARFRHRRRRIG